MYQYWNGGQVIDTLTARNAGGGQRMPDKQNFNSVIDTERLTVRRLTPLECERLQGFPDGWTDIGAWVGETARATLRVQTPRATRRLAIALPSHPGRMS